MGVGARPPLGGGNALGGAWFSGFAHVVADDACRELLQMGVEVLGEGEKFWP